MKKNIINTLKSSLSLLLIFTFSCVDLNESPEGTLTPANFYSTTDQCEAALVGSMTSLITTWGGYCQTPGWPDGQQPSDLGFSSTSHTSHWQWHWQAINNINPVIGSIKAGRLDTYSKTIVDNILGQAYYLRAFNYFWLVQLYGKIPFIDEETPDLITTPLTPESKLEISVLYTKIVSDLENAITLLGDYNSSNPAKPNIWMAKALLSKVYLTGATAPLNNTSYFSLAASMADDVIKNGPYGLLEINEIFKSSNPNNKEFIFAFQYTDDFPAMPGINWGPEEWGTWSSGPVRTVWAEQYPEQPRKHYYMRINWPKDLQADPWEWIYYTNSIAKIPWDGKKTWPNITVAQQTSDGGNAGILLPILRFSELLLIYAEAENMAQGGPTQLAVDRVNLLIDRANKAFDSEIPQTSIAGTQARVDISMSKDEFDQRIFEERNWELCFEFTAYFDVLRKRKLKDVNEPDIALDFREADYLFPIPALDAKDIGQNDGYE